MPWTPITSALYNIKSISAGNSELLCGVPRSGFIANSSSPQNADLNIAGSGIIDGDLSVAGAFTTALISVDSQYHSGADRVLSIAGSQNALVGRNAGTPKVSGSSNAFFGNFSGSSNTTRIANSTFGADAGRTNNGTANSYVGRSAGYANTSGGDNSFFGNDAGRFNTAGQNNMFVGALACSSTALVHNKFQRGCVKEA